MDKRIGFIGAGQMAEALARGFIAKGVCTADRIFATDVVAERKQVFRGFGTNPVDSNEEVCARGAPRGSKPSVRRPGGWAAAGAALRRKRAPSARAPRARLTTNNHRA
mgnify:CR=1 FL=1